MCKIWFPEKFECGEKIGVLSVLSQFLFRPDIEDVAGGKIVCARKGTGEWLLHFTGTTRSS